MNFDELQGDLRRKAMFVGMLNEDQREEGKLKMEFWKDLQSRLMDQWSLYSWRNSVSHHSLLKALAFFGVHQKALKLSSVL
jgi:hypothetical protein